MEDKNYEELQNAIKHFEDKIAKQGMITNARDEEHLTRLKIMQLDYLKGNTN